MTTYSCAIQPTFSARVNKLPHTDSRVITECNIVYYSKSCRFFALYSFRIWEIQNWIFNETCIKHMKCSLWRITHAWTVFYVGIVIYHFLFTVQKEWARKVGRQCTMEEAGSLYHKYLCRDHFLPTDFMTPEGIRLNRMAVPLGLDSASHCIPQSSPPLLPTRSNPQLSAVNPQNSNLPVLPPLPLTSGPSSPLGVAILTEPSIERQTYTLMKLSHLSTFWACLQSVTCN
jgi:hypothetical protein